MELEKGAFGYQGGSAGKICQIGLSVEKIIRITNEICLCLQSEELFSKHRDYGRTKEIILQRFFDRPLSDTLCLLKIPSGLVEISTEELEIVIRGLCDGDSRGDEGQNGAEMP